MEIRSLSKFVQTGFAGTALSLLNGGAGAQAQCALPPRCVESTGSVGIGTTSPAGPLHNLAPALEPPVGLPAAQNGLLLGLQSTAGYKWIQSYGGALALNPKGNNVGIGTTSPGATLHVSSARDFNSPQAEITQTTPQDFARLRFASFGIDPDDPSHPRPFPLWDIAAGSGVLNLFVQATGNIMTLTSIGKVGIRTEQPATELDVNGTATVKVLQITGGADLSEHFEVRGAADVGSAASPPIEAGLVVSIDPDEPGKLVVSSQAYDQKVAWHH